MRDATTRHLDRVVSHWGTVSIGRLPCRLLQDSDEGIEAAMCTLANDSRFEVPYQ